MPTQFDSRAQPAGFHRFAQNAPAAGIVRPQLLSEAHQRSAIAAMERRIGQTVLARQHMHHRLPEREQRADIAGRQGVADFARPAERVGGHAQSRCLTGHIGAELTQHCFASCRRLLDQVLLFLLPEQEAGAKEGAQHNAGERQQNARQRTPGREGGSPAFPDAQAGLGRQSG